MIQTWFADDNTKMTILTINKNIKGCADDCGSSDCNQTVGGIRPRGWFQPTGIMMVIMRMMMRMRMRMRIMKLLCVAKKRLLDFTLTLHTFRLEK